MTLAILALWSLMLQGQTTSPYALSTHANLVVVPTQVKTKQGEYIYGLQANQFVLTDDGVRQHLRLDDNPIRTGLSLVVLVQCTGAAALEITKLKGLEALVEGVVGDSPHEIAIVSFGDGPTLLSDFTNDSAKLTSAVSGIRLCGEEGAATLDSVYSHCGSAQPGLLRRWLARSNQARAAPSAKTRNESTCSSSCVSWK